MAEQSYLMLIHAANVFKGLPSPRGCASTNALVMVPATTEDRGELG